MLAQNVLDQVAGIEQRAAIDAPRAGRERQGNGAVGRGVHHRAVLDAVLDQRERRRMHEPRQRLRIQLAREHAAARAAPRILGARRRLVEHRNHLERAVGESRDHGGGGEENVDHHDHLPGDAHAVELLFAREDVNLVIQFYLRQHR